MHSTPAQQVKDGKEEETAKMTGIKRTHEGVEVSKTNKSEGQNASQNPQSRPGQQQQHQSPYMAVFEHFRDELDEHYDRRERIIKASRDITANSKKIIFALQRMRSTPCVLPASIVKDVDARLATNHALLKSLHPDLKNINAYRYIRQVSPALQEFVEALSFRHYISTQSLITLEQTQAEIDPEIVLTPEDYVLGLFDLTGEMMRFAITSIATNGELPGGTNGGSVLQDLHAVGSSLMAICGTDKAQVEFSKKLVVTLQSISKVENAAYGLVIRGKERQPGWVPDTQPGLESSVEA